MKILIVIIFLNYRVSISVLLLMRKTQRITTRAITVVMINCSHRDMINDVRRAKMINGVFIPSLCSVFQSTCGAKQSNVISAKDIADCEEMIAQGNIRGPVIMIDFSADEPFNARNSVPIISGKYVQSYYEGKYDIIDDQLIKLARYVVVQGICLDRKFARMAATRRDFFELHRILSV